MSCHVLADQSAGSLGPSLLGLFGRSAGTASGFGYSRAMRDSGVKWSDDTLDYFLAAPQGYIPGTSMSAEPVIDDAQRWNIVAYIKSLSGH